MKSFIQILVFCSIFLFISLGHGVHYLLLKRKLKFILKEKNEKIHEAIRCDKPKFTAFLLEPLETGNDMLDLLLFKTHRAAIWFVRIFIFYVTSVLFLYFAMVLLRKG